MFVGSHAWDRYARSTGPHGKFMSFSPDYFVIPDNGHVAMWSVGTTVAGEHGFHHGVCGLYFAKERP
jgi:hypothetical protein